MASTRPARAAFSDEMRRRIDLVAADYGTPEAEVLKVRERLKHYDVVCFAQKHSIALDWPDLRRCERADADNRREANMKRRRRSHRKRNRQRLAAHARRLRR